MYKVVLINQLQGGFVLEEAKGLLAEKVKLTETQLEKILSSPDYAVLRTEKRDLANRVASMIHNCGFSAEVISNRATDESHEDLSWSQPRQGIKSSLLAAVESIYLQVAGTFKKERSLVVVAASALLLAVSSAAGLLSLPTLDDAADYALDSILLSGEPVSADLLTRFARQDIRACFNERVHAWNPDNYEQYVESLNRMRQMRGQEGQLYAYQRAVEKKHPGVMPVLIAGLACPEEFMVN